MPITPYHAKYFAYELTRQRRGGDMDRIATSLFDAEVDINPHQIDAALRTFWLFMLWRIQSHSSVDQQVEEVKVAFPDLLLAFPANDYLLPERNLSMLIESRFIERFLQFENL